MKRTILAAMVLSLALSGCNTAYNYFEDDDDGAPTPAGGFNLAHSLMKQAGVVPKDTQPIAYRPRAPLAIPGSNDLPPPQDAKAANEAETAVNFPVDQAEQEKERKAQLAAALADGQRLPTSVSPDSLPPEAAAAQKEAKAEPFTMREKSPIRSVKEMSQKLTFRQPAESLLTEEGTAVPRKYLIQPPDEYRTPAETASLPEEGDIENSEWLNKQLYRDVQSGNTPSYKK